MNSLKLLSENSQAHPPWKNPLLPFYSLPTPPKKFKKVQVPLFANIKNFSGPLQKGGEDTMVTDNDIFNELYAVTYPEFLGDTEFSRRLGHDCDAPGSSEELFL